MGAFLQNEDVEFHTARAERIMLGIVFILVGGGMSVFWNVERSTAWPLITILLAGMFFFGLGLFMIGFRRIVLLQNRQGVSELHSLFGVILARQSYPLTDFEAVGSHGSIQEGPWWDVVLFRHDGKFFVLRTMLSDTEAKREVEKASRSLGLPAEYEPKARFYLFK